VDAVVLVIVGLLVVFVLASRMLPRFRSDGHDSAVGKVLETRIVMASTGESTMGSYAFYRIEAHVTFDVNGEKQDRWIPASEVNSSREELELQLIDRPGTCRVSWSPRHPENAHCSLQRASN
jgi:hypothetical protein